MNDNFKNLMLELFPPVGNTHLSGGWPTSPIVKEVIHNRENNNRVEIHTTDSPDPFLAEEDISKSRLNSRPYLRCKWESLPADILNKILLCKREVLVKREVTTYNTESLLDKKIIVVVPISARSQNLSSVLESFSVSSDIGVVVCEYAPEETVIKDIALNKECSYIHIERGNKPFNKSECMNISYSVLTHKTNAKWFMFHDADVYLCSSFEQDVMSRIEREDCPSIFQCFSNKCVTYLEGDQSDLFRSFIDEHKKVSEQDFIDFMEEAKKIGLLNKKPTPGAPGGSICIHRDLFNAIGGYDDDWVHAYGPEDALFLIKANYFYDKTPYTKLNTGQGCHRMETSNLNCTGVHLWHPPPSVPEIADGTQFAVSELILNAMLGAGENFIDAVFELSSANIKRMIELYSTVEVG